MQKSSAIVLTAGLLDTKNAKTCHGLLRGTERFALGAVIDLKFAGQDAGKVVFGEPNGIPVYANVDSYLESTGDVPRYFIIGVAPEGGLLPDTFREELYKGMERGISIVCGLHTLLNDDPAFKQKATKYGVELMDIRRPKKATELKFWSGEIYSVKAAIIAVLGTDCAVGKRTTSRILMERANAENIKTELMYTGQTGWMQGYKYGFIFDATLNDFISGEIEHTIVNCDRNENPDLILIEGQSSMRNPSGPCGSEFLISGNAQGVILQHEPGRTHYDFNSAWGEMKPLEEEVELIAAYGAQVLCITLNTNSMDSIELNIYQKEMEQELGIPVIMPIEEGTDRLLQTVENYLESRKKYQEI
ncbi:MAG: DUF1611 domain-containing protein [Maribacter sp.]